MIHLDTSFLIRSLVRGSPQDRKLRHWLKAGETLSMSTIAWCEFLCGPVGEDQAELASTIVSERVSFLEADASLAAWLFNESGRRRGSLTDCMIAATALRSGAALATANPSDFARFEKAGATIVTT